MHRLLGVLRENGPSTQTALVRATGLSAATVSNLVRDLGEREVVRTSNTIRSGRRAVLVELGEQAGRKVAIGVDVGRRHMRVIACTGSREILADVERPLPTDHRPQQTVDAVADTLADVLRRGGLAHADVVGCGVGVPAPIDRRTGEVGHGAVLPEWVGLDLSRIFADRLDLPVLVDNDADLGAIAETTWGPHVDANDLLFVKVASGVGAGLLLDGRLHRGSVGMAGEIGHTAVSEYGPICRCGARGCLEAVASVRAILEAVGAGSAQPPTVEELIERANRGDSATVRVIQDAGYALGGVLGGVANLLAPGVIVVGGPLTPIGDLFLEPVRRGLARHAVPTIAEATSIVLSTLAGRAEALGACTQVLRSVPQDSWL